MNKDNKSLMPQSAAPAIANPNPDLLVPFSIDFISAITPNTNPIMINPDYALENLKGKLYSLE